MHIANTNNNEIKNLIESGKKIAIIPCRSRGSEAFYAAAGFFHMLSDKSKEVSFLYTGGVPNNAKNLIKSEHIKTDFNDRFVEVAIDYSGTNASKVHYSNEDNQVFKIKIGPIDNNFDLSRVKSTISGFDYDLVFTFGASDLAHLGDEFDSVITSLKVVKIINIDNKESNRRFGTLNVVDTAFESLSLLVFSYSPVWNLKPNIASAQAILSGLSPEENKVQAFKQITERLPSEQ